LKEREEAMSAVPNPSIAALAPATLGDVRRIVGNIEDVTAMEILALRPTTDDIEQAAIWSAGDGDLLARQGRPLSGTVAAIVDILMADEEEPPSAR
jgi:hypothetical protein